MFKYFAVLSFVMLFLVGCVAAPNQGAKDPYAVIGEQQGYIRATEQAQMIQAQSATLEAAKAQEKAKAEIDILNARLGATQTAYAIQGQQATATTSAAMSTSTVEARHTTETPQEASRIATGTVTTYRFVQQQKKDEWDQTWRNFTSWFYPVLAVAGVCFITYLLSQVALALIDAWQQHMRHKHTPKGDFTYMPLLGPGGEPVKLSNGTEVWTWQLIASVALPDGGRKSLQFSGQSSDDSQFRELSKSLFTSLPDSKLQSPDKPIKDVILDFLVWAIEVNGTDSNELPSWTKFQKYGFNVNSVPWTYYTDTIGAAGGLYSIPRKGTYVSAPFQTLGELEDAIRRGKLKIKPLTAEIVE